MRRGLRALWLRTYPAALRREYGAEMQSVARELGARAEYQGILGRLRLGGFLAADAVRSAVEERGLSAGPSAHAPPYGRAVIAGMAVLALYVATLAPTIGFWDSGEYITAAHILGIPHPPGNPLFVLTAHVWERALMGVGIAPAVALNLYSAVLSAMAHGFLYLLAWRALQGATADAQVRRVGAMAAVLLSATAFTVWNQSNVNEKVYALSLLSVVLSAWLVVRWRDAGRRSRYLVAAFFTLVLTSTNHLMGVLAAPALLAFVLVVDARALLRKRLAVACAAALVVGLLPQFFLPIRAAQRPILAETEPACESAAGAVASVYTWGRTGCEALGSTLRREQYDKPSLSLDPTVYPHVDVPRPPSLVAAQFANWLQYFDWQWSRSVDGRDPVFGGARPLFTLLFVLLGLLGARTLWQLDRPAAVLTGVLFLTFSAGLVVYLNFKYGYTLALERYPDADFHEVRERDYFFLVGFSLWGLWSGLGLAVAWQRLKELAAPRMRMPALATAPVLGIALLPLALNWQWASRADDWTARDWAYNVLMSVEPYGVLFTNGDNDTFPLWYLQEVEGLRRDVTVLVTTYLNTGWYARQARDLTRPCPAGVSAADAPARIVCQRAFDPGQIPLGLASLMPAGEAPEDTILPLSDAEIDRLAGTRFITGEPLTFHAGETQGTIAAGTEILPADTFVAAILKASLGRRPIHFAAPTPVLEKLGLYDRAVRHGLTLRLHEGTVPPSQADDLVPMPPALRGIGGAYVDLPFTDTLLNVALRRGRIADPDAPFVDHAVASIVMQYAWAHYAAAQAHAARGDAAQANRHILSAEEWRRIVDG